MKTAAWRGVTWPDGSGRLRVRSTRPSRSRSIRSFQAEPAPRMTIAPIQNSTRWTGSGKGRPEAIAASAADHQQGRSRSHQPMGRSNRAIRR